jgi:hypothetical protein
VTRVAVGFLVWVAVFLLLRRVYQDSDTESDLFSKQCHGLQGVLQAHSLGSGRKSRPLPNTDLWFRATKCHEDSSTCSRPRGRGPAPFNCRNFLAISNMLSTRSSAPSPS